MQLDLYVKSERLAEGLVRCSLYGLKLIKSHCGRKTYAYIEDRLGDRRMRIEEAILARSFGVLIWKSLLRSSKRNLRI